MRSNARSKISEPIKEENNSQEHYEPKTSTYRNKYRRNLYLKDTELKNDDKLMHLIQDSTSSPTSLIRRNKKKTEEKKQEMLLTEPNTNSYKRTKKRHKKLNEEKINEDNNNSNSFISKSYRNNYNNNFDETQNKKIDEKTKITNKYEFMEINDVDKILTKDLKQIYSQIKFDNIDFKNNIFYKNFENLIDSMGTFDKMKKNYVPSKNSQEVLDNILPPNLLVQKYTQKVNK
jgi:hypothetical protein